MQTVDEPVNRLKHQEIVGFLQPGINGLLWGTAPKMWPKATENETDTDTVISGGGRGELQNQSCEATATREMLSSLISAQNQHFSYSSEETCQLCDPQTQSSLAAWRF